MAGKRRLWTMFRYAPCALFTRRNFASENRFTVSRLQTTFHRARKRDEDRDEDREEEREGSLTVVFSNRLSDN